ncbi:DUF1073 domain-containing protein [Thioclava sp.]|uniref:DUF1073 domain-containing protein n=1 Tax=Thioclava sp. TaxID=1933450 RepID=UPI003241D8AC
MTKPHYRRTADGATVKLDDGYRNLVANLGTDRDKAAGGHYAYQALDYQQLLDAYRSAWLPQAIVDIPAQDATRNWRAWQAKKEQITALEATEKRLNVREKVRDTMRSARLYGGAAMMILDGASDTSKPLMPSAIRKGGIKGLVTLTPMTLSAGSIDWDIYSPHYGKPGSYTLTNASGDILTVHPSRLVVFDGVPVPDQSLVSTGWGDSVLSAAMEAVKQADGASANIASLLFEAKIDITYIQGLAEALANGNEQAIADRLRFAMMMKGINGSLILDAGDVDPDSGKQVGGEKYEQKSAQLSGLSDLMDKFAQVVCGAAQIPMSRLYGRGAAGLNATGDGDERVYFDRISDKQQLEMQPAMALLDECLIMDALGNRPSEIYYEWRPLRQQTPAEKAEIFGKVATAARAIAGASSGELMPIEALSDGLVNRLIEDGSLPGLDAAMEAHGRLGENDPGLEEEAAAMGTTPQEPQE